MAEHKISKTYSGSFIQDTTVKEGDEDFIIFSTPYGVQYEQFIEAECSCGETFDTEEEVEEHVKKVRNKKVE